MALNERSAQAAQSQFEQMYLYARANLHWNRVYTYISSNLQDFFRIDFPRRYSIAHQIVHHGNVNEFERFLTLFSNQHIDIKTPTRDNKTFLDIAAENRKKNPDMYNYVERLFMQDNLLQSAKEGDWREVTDILNTNPELANEKPPYSSNFLLHYVIQHGNKNMLEELINVYDCSKDVMNSEKETPLAMAKRLGKHDMCSILDGTVVDESSDITKSIRSSAKSNSSELDQTSAVGNIADPPHKEIPIVLSPHNEIPIVLSPHNEIPIVLSPPSKQDILTEQDRKNSPMVTGNLHQVASNENQIGDQPEPRGLKVQHRTRTILRESPGDDVPLVSSSTSNISSPRSQKKFPPQVVHLTSNLPQSNANLIKESSGTQVTVNDFSQKPACVTKSVPNPSLSSLSSQSGVKKSHQSPIDCSSSIFSPSTSTDSTSPQNIETSSNNPNLSGKNPLIESISDLGPTSTSSSSNLNSASPTASSPINSQTLSQIVNMLSKLKLPTSATTPNAGLPSASSPTPTATEAAVSASESKKENLNPGLDAKKVESTTAAKSTQVKEPLSENMVPMASSSNSPTSSAMTPSEAAKLQEFISFLKTAKVELPTPATSSSNKK